MGLDWGLVLLHDGREASRPRRDQGHAQRPEFSTTVLGFLLKDPHTYYLPEPNVSGSSLGLAAVVAAPIRDENGHVAGAVYGSR